MQIFSAESTHTIASQTWLVVRDFVDTNNLTINTTDAIYYFSHLRFLLPKSIIMHLIPRLHLIPFSLFSARDFAHDGVNATTKLEAGGIRSAVCARKIADDIATMPL